MEVPGPRGPFDCKPRGALLQVGCYDVSFGLESAAVEILTAMNKKMDIDKASANIRSLPSRLETHGSFIVGMPGENQSTIGRTINFIKEVGLKHAGAGILTVFPGTALYDMAKTKGMIKMMMSIVIILGRCMPGRT